MHTQFLIFPPTKPPFPIPGRARRPARAAAPEAARSGRRPAALRESSASDLARIFAGFRVAQVYVGHAR